MVIAFYYAIKYNHPRRIEKYTRTEVVTTIKKSILGLICPLIIIGGIFSGQFTPTEAAAVACAYALIIGLFVFRSLTWKDVLECFGKSAVISAVILLVITTATLFATVLTLERVPANIARAMTSLTNNKYVFLMLVNLLLLFMGMIMETGANVILLAPILLPLAMKYGIHPLHFALVMLVNLNIGLVTPPLGVCLFVAAPIADVKYERIAIASLPFIAAEIVVLMLITYIPELILILPRLFGFA